MLHTILAIKKGCKYMPHIPVTGFHSNTVTEPMTLAKTQHWEKQQNRPEKDVTLNLVMNPVKTKLHL
ncbi:hypothetical protein C7N43_11400 [Sphingobacteriales bacterium UPWRP_1]|nr:hypothetical protein C7N43_11400 [Sphingobacteriales bacterium UPWRP_1]